LKKSTLIFWLMLFAPWSAAMAEIDPEEILRQLPPPEVNYTLPEIRAVKPPVTLPDYSTVEYYGRSKPSTKELERSIRQIKSLADNPAVSSTLRLIKHLSDDVKADNENSTPAVQSGAATQKTAQQPQASVDSLTPPRAIKPPPVAAAPATPVAPATPSYPPPTGNLMSAWQTLRKNPGLAELEASLARDRQLAEDTFTMAMLLSADQPAEGDEVAAEGETEGESAPAGSHDAVLATAIGLYKQQDWKGLKNLFAENPEAGETKDGLRYIIEAEINEAKPNYMQVRRYSDQLRGLDENDAMANYGLALYHYNAKKPDTAKAGEHLAVALKAKNPPQGASAFYWKMTFNKFMIPLLLVIAGLIGGISHVIKKRKAAATIDLDKPAAAVKTEAEAKPKGKLTQKLAPLLDKFKGLLARFKKKKAADIDISAPEKTEAVAGAAEAQEIEESADDQESAEEESEEEAEESAEDEESDEEEAEEENELESEDEEAVAEESEEEEESA
jgi:hypothetical protein